MDWMWEPMNNQLIESGISHFDEMIGGLPLNSSTLVYGPPKTGKSVFCYEFALKGLKLGEPCLYLAADYDIRLLRQTLSSFNWELDDYFAQGKVYMIDAISTLAGAHVDNTENYKTSSVQDPTDLMVKIGLGTRFLYSQNTNFRAIFDSLNTMFAFNPDMMVLRLLGAYVRRIKEAKGTSLICYTEGIASSQVENQLKSNMDNILYFDGENIYIESMLGIDQTHIPYIVTENGLKIR
jgi:KaiC/GvpD/RAD55 family RecA-like ATPase